MGNAKPISRGTTVSEVMTNHVICISATDSIQRAADLLFSADVRHLPVVENGAIVGIVSDRDICTLLGTRLHVAEEQKRILSQPISSICESDLICVGPEDDIREAIDHMLEHRIGAVLVTRTNGEKEIVGILSYVDVLRYFRDGIE